MQRQQTIPVQLPVPADPDSDREQTTGRKHAWLRFIGKSAILVAGDTIADRASRQNHRILPYRQVGSEFRAAAAIH